jgi:hypothetical protein
MWTRISTQGVPYVLYIALTPDISDEGNTILGFSYPVLLNVYLHELFRPRNVVLVITVCLVDWSRTVIKVWHVLLVNAPVYDTRPKHMLHMCACSMIDTC